MAIRVSSNQMIYNYKKQLNDANARQDKLLEQGDGSKLHRPSDDSVAYTKYLRYDTSQQENEQYQENVSTGVSWMKASDAALVSMKDIQTTFKEKTVAAANGDKTNEDMAAIGKEMMAEIQQLVSLGNTQQGDRYLFAGQKDTTQPFSLSEKEVERGLAPALQPIDRDGESVLRSDDKLRRRRLLRKRETTLEDSLAAILPRRNPPCPAEIVVRKRDGVSANPLRPGKGGCPCCHGRADSPGDDKRPRAGRSRRWPPPTLSLIIDYSLFRHNGSFLLIEKWIITHCGFPLQMAAARRTSPSGHRH